MNEEIFRKKNLDKVKSPENLDDYIKVSNPSVWLLLISVIVLLAGVCVWGIFGHIESTVNASIRIDGETKVCTIADEDRDSVKTGMTVKFDEFEAVIAEIGQKNERGYVCRLQSEQAIPNGIYDGKILISSIRPISFVLN